MTTESDIKIGLIHDDGEVGELWKKFMEEMFTVDLPEELRDLRLNVVSQSIGYLNEDEIASLQSCTWKLFLFSQTMMTELQNDKSALGNSDLFETNADQVIVLILGEADDKAFHDDVRKTLYAFPDFTKFHLVNATSPAKIFTDIISIVSPLYIVFHPNVLSSEDKEQHLTLIGNKAFPKREGFFFIVEFDDGKDKQEVEATLFNPCTLLFQNPGLRVGMINVKLFACSRDEDTSMTRNQVGEQMTVWVQCDMDRLNSIMEKVNNPFNFLCQALNVDPRNASALDAVDRKLTDSFLKYVPENQLASVFGTDHGADMDGGEGKSQEYAPTLLHFAAMYGLRSLAAELIKCPGSVKAFGTANCDGDYPTNLAEKYGHWELKKFMNSYMEVSAMVDSGIGNSRSTSDILARMVSGSYLPVNESIYDAHAGMNEKRPVGYVPMKSLVGGVSEVKYDRPFIVPIPLCDDQPNYESILAQMIESDDIYMSFDSGQDDGGHVNLDPLQEEAPTLPPRAFSPPTHDEEHSASAHYSSYPSNVPWSAPPPLPPDRQPPSDICDPSIRPGGADRVSYGSLNIPLMHSYVSPAQRELITLQHKVKNKELTTNQAVIRFKEWERKHKEQGASFQLQQERLERVRNSLMKNLEQKRLKGEQDTLEISEPIIAGSSTYDRVLKKTLESDPSEIIYGQTHAQKPQNTKAHMPPKLDDGFSRSRRPRMSVPNEYATRGSMSSGTSSSDRSSNRSLETATYSPAQPRAPRSDSPGFSFAPPVPPRDHGSVYSPPFVPPRPPVRDYM